MHTNYNMSYSQAHNKCCNMAKGEEYNMAQCRIKHYGPKLHIATVLPTVRYCGINIQHEEKEFRMSRMSQPESNEETQVCSHAMCSSTQLSETVEIDPPWVPTSTRLNSKPCDSSLLRGVLRRQSIRGSAAVLEADGLWQDRDFSLLGGSYLTSWCHGCLLAMEVRHKLLRIDEGPIQNILQHVAVEASGVCGLVPPSPLSFQEVLLAKLQRL